MSIKSKVLAAAATLTMAGGLGAIGTVAATTANAATPSCGHTCVNIYSNKFSHYFTFRPSYVLDVLRQGERVGQPIIMFRSSNADPAEDFTITAQGTVNDFVLAGLASKALDLHYATHEAYEIQYSPYGVDSGLCIGVPGTAIPDLQVSLQPCGVTASTVWVAARNSAVFAGKLFGPTPLINGSDTNFSQPFVLTYPQNAFPTDMPRPQLTVQNLHKFSNGAVYDTQLWWAFYGVLR